MKTVNIHEAKTHLSRLVEEAAHGHEFIIAKAGKPMVKVIPLQPAEPKTHRVGFLDHLKWNIPEDFNTMDQEWIEKIFYEGDNSLKTPEAAAEIAPGKKKRAARSPDRRRR